MTVGFRALVAAALAFIAGCTGPEEQAPVWVGHLSPLSGPRKASGESARRGILLAVEEANRDPQTAGAGRPVRVRHTDTRGDPEAFGAEATRLVTVNRVAALLGGTDLADIHEFRRLNRPGLVLVTPLGRRPGSRGAGNVFFTGLSPARRGAALARFAADRGFGNVLVLVDDEDPAGELRAVAEAFREKLPRAWRKKHPKRKASRTVSRRYGADNPLEKRARTVARDLTRSGKAGRSDPQAILLAGKPEAVRTLGEAMGSARLPVLFGGAEGSVRDLVEEPETAGAVYLATAFTPDAGTGLAREFVRRYRKRFGEEPDVHAALAYDGARILFAGLRKALEQGGDLAEALAATNDFACLAGPLSVDANGQAQRPLFIVGVRDGKATKVRCYAPE
jgi:branched-chain amino acid transport system substrate-binding protein